MLARICAPWLESNGYDLQAASGSEVRLLRFDRMSSVREELDLALGRAAPILRRAAGSCPLAARLIKQFLGIAQPAPGSDLAWTLSAASEGALRLTGAPSVASLRG